MAKANGLALILALVALPCTAAEVKSLGDYATDLRDYAVSPLHWDASDWRWAGGALVGIAAAYSLDNTVHRQFTDANAPLASNGHSVRDAAPLALLLGGTLLAGSLHHDSALTQTAFDMTEAVALGTVSSYVFKTIARRERPNKSLNHDDWGRHGDSFPSGHTTAAFAAAQVLADRLPPEQWGWRALAYGLATATAYERLNSNVHWFSDVAAGAALGIATGRFMSGRAQPDQRVAFSVAPLDHGAMLSFTVDTSPR